MHRAGRTARAQRDGVSLLLVGPDDRANFLKLLRLPGKGADAFPPLAEDAERMQAVRRRVLVCVTAALCRVSDWRYRRRRAIWSNICTSSRNVRKAPCQNR